MTETTNLPTVGQATAAHADVQTIGANLLAQMERAVVNSPESAATMTDALKFVDTKLKAAEDARTALVGPLNAHVKFINGGFKTATEPMEKAKQVGRGKLASYLQEQERIRVEAEREARRAAEAEALRVAAEREKEGDQAGADQALEAGVAVERAVVVAPAPVRGTFGGSAGLRKTWTYETVDLTKVPREYLMLDERKVKDAIAAGVRTIDGLTILQKSGLNVR